MISSKVPLPLASLLTQIEGAIEARLFYAALTIALTLPDVCASLEADPKKGYWSNKSKYVEWFDKNVSERFSSVDGEACYCMRGGVVHTGQFRHVKSTFDRVLFVFPGSPIYGHDITFSIAPDVAIGGMGRAEIAGNMVNREPTGDVLLMDIVQFCATIVDAVCDWSLTKLDDDNFKDNISNLVHYRPDGWPPLLVGSPVIG